MRDPLPPAPRTGSPPGSDTRSGPRGRETAPRKGAAQGCSLLPGGVAGCLPACPELENQGRFPPAVTRSVEAAVPKTRGSHTGSLRGEGPSGVTSPKSTDSVLGDGLGTAHIEFSAALSPVPFGLLLQRQDSFGVTRRRNGELGFQAVRVPLPAPALPMLGPAGRDARPPEPVALPVEVRWGPGGQSPIASFAGEGDCSLPVRLWSSAPSSRGPGKSPARLAAPRTQPGQTKTITKRRFPGYSTTTTPPPRPELASTLSPGNDSRINWPLPGTRVGHWREGFMAVRSAGLRISPIGDRGTFR